MRKIRVTREIDARTPLEALERFAQFDPKLPPNIELMDSGAQPAKVISGPESEAIR